MPKHIEYITFLVATEEEKQKMQSHFNKQLVKLQHPRLVLIMEAQAQRVNIFSNDTRMTASCQMQITRIKIDMFNALAYMMKDDLLNLPTRQQRRKVNLRLRSMGEQTWDLLKTKAFIPESLPWYCKLWTRILGR